MSNDSVPVLNMLDNDHDTLISVVRYMNHFARNNSSAGYTQVSNLTVGDADGTRIDIKESGSLPVIQGYDSDGDLRVEYLADRIKFYDADGDVGQTLSITTENKTITVGVGKDFASIQDAVDSVPMFINHFITIKLYNGTYTEDVLVKGRLGTGVLSIERDSVGAVAIKSIAFINCHVGAGIYFGGDAFAGSITMFASGMNSVRAYNSSYVFIRYLTITTNCTPDGAIAIDFGSNCQVSSCAISNQSETAISCTYGSKLSTDTISGTSNNYGLFAITGGEIAMIDYTYPTATIPFHYASGGRIYGPNGNVSGSDGWSTVKDTLSYSAADRLVMYGDATVKYETGDKLRLKQGAGYKYFYVTGTYYNGVDSSYVYVNGGTDYTVANSAVTDVYVSKAETPQDFPNLFNFTSTITGATSVSQACRFQLCGSVCKFFFRIAGTSDATSFKALLPITAKNNGGYSFEGALGLARDNGTYLTTACRQYINPATDATVLVFDPTMAGGSWTASGAKEARGVAIYEIA